MEKITIRLERMEDRAQVATLIARTYGADGAFVVELAAKLRSHTAAGTPMALVGEAKEKVAAFVLFTPLEFDGVEKVVFMSPIAAEATEELEIESFMAQAYDALKKEKYTHVAVLGDSTEMEPHGFIKPDKLQSTPVQEDGVVLIKALKGGGALAGVLKLPEFLA